MFEGEVDCRGVGAHGGVDVDGGLDAGMLDAETEGEVSVVGGGIGEGVCGEVGEEGCFGGGGVRGVD